MPAGSSTLLFRHPTRQVRRSRLRAYLADLAARIGRGREVTCLISTDRELRGLNRRFRGKDCATDVLSFPPDGSGGGPGEIAISLDRAGEQAAAAGHNLEEELCILILHGMLHLAGMDHETDRGEMAREETRWRKLLGLPTGLIERVVA